MPAPGTVSLEAATAGRIGTQSSRLRPLPRVRRPRSLIGHIFALALDPANPSTLYAGTSQGVYQSTNAGTSWTLTSTGLVTSSVGPYVQAIAVSPVPPITFYAGTSVGVYSSTNPATNWVFAGLYRANVRALAIDTNPPVTLYAATTDGAYLSTDQGGSWSGINNGLTNLFCLALAIDPQTHSNLYVGTTDGLFKSTNSGNNWTLLFSLSNLGYTNGLQINAFAFDPATSTTVYAGTDQGTFKSADGGMTWNPVTNGLSALPTYALAVSPANPDLLYAGTIEFPVTNSSDAFLTTLDATPGSIGSILTSTILSGDGTNEGWAVAVDAADNAYIVGVTTSTNFSTDSTEGFLSATNNGGYDVFVTAINADASAFLYSAYLGGADADFGYGIAVDKFGNAFVVGQTFFTRLPGRQRTGDQPTR